MTSKTKFVLIVASLYFIGAASAFAVTTYTVNTKGQALEQYVQAIADRVAAEQKYQEVSELIQETAAEREALTKYLLAEDDTITFLASIETIGVEQGVILETNSLQVVNKEGNPGILEIQFGITGSEVLVFRMLSILESLPYHSTLTKLKFERSEAGSDTVKLLVTLHVTLK